MHPAPTLAPALALALAASLAAALAAALIQSKRFSKVGMCSAGMGFYS